MQFGVLRLVVGTLRQQGKLELQGKRKWELRLEWKMKRLLLRAEAANPEDEARAQKRTINPPTPIDVDTDSEE